MAKIKKKDVEKAMEGLRKLGGKVKEVAKIIEKDAVYGTQVGKLRIKILALERDKFNQFREIGKVAYKLFLSKKLKDATLAKQCTQLNNIEKAIKKQHAEITKLKKSFKGKKK